MRTAILNLTLGLSIGIVACGDSKTTPDASDKTPDSQTIDAAPLFKGYQADEGGEVKIEYMLFGNGNASIRAQNFIYKTAGSVAWHPYASFNGCTNVDKGQGLFPTAQNPASERVYMDPGLVLVSGGPTTMTLRRNATACLDSVGRDHPAGQCTYAGGNGPFTGSTVNDGYLYVTEKTSYDVTFTGSAEIPPQTFKGALWMPGAFTLVNPPIGTYPLLAGVDQTVTWTIPTEDGLPPDMEVRSLVAFAGPQGLSIYCIKPGNDGSMTITAAAADIARAKYPTGGAMARLNTVHNVRELVDINGPTGRRIDFITAWCNATSFSVP